MIVKQKLSAKFEIEFIPKFTNPFKNLGCLVGDIFLVVESDCFWHKISSGQN